MQYGKHLITFIGILLLLGGCSLPFGDSSTEQQTGIELRLRAAVSTEGKISANTVLPDIGEQNLTWQVVLTRNDGLRRASTAAGSVITISDLVPGVWDLEVQGYNEDNELVTNGSQTDIELSLGEILILDVAVVFVQTGQGSFSLPIAFPAALGIDAVTAELRELGGVLAAAVPATVETQGATARVVLQAAGLDAGAYELFITFSRSGTVVGAFVEGVTILTAVHSDRWISQDGELLLERQFSASEFQDSNTSLGGLDVTGGELDPLFSSALTNYVLRYAPSGAVMLTPRTSVGGQLIEYCLNAAAYQSIASGDTITLETPQHEDELLLRVTAPDRGSTRVYQITLNDSGAQGPPYTVSYDPNGGNNAPAPGGDVDGAYTVLAWAGSSRVRDGISMRFAGWNTARDGTGLLYQPGEVIIVAEDMTIYAQWDVIGGTGPGGGIVFYDKGNYGNGWRYMEIAPQPQPQVEINWSNVADKTVGDTSTEIGFGRHNSLLIQAQVGHTDSAAAIAAGFSIEDGYTDWFLPSVEELEEAFGEDRVALQELGATRAWTSTEHPFDLNGRVYAVEPTSPFFGSDYMKNMSTYTTRFYPVRAFAGPEQRQVILYHPNGADGGTAPVDPRYYPSGSTVRVLDAGTLSNTGYSFVTWSPAKDGTGNEYQPDSDLFITDDIVLYAQWQ